MPEAAQDAVTRAVAAHQRLGHLALAEEVVDESEKHFKVCRPPRCFKVVASKTKASSPSHGQPKRAVAAPPRVERHRPAIRPLHAAGTQAE